MLIDVRVGVGASSGSISRRTLLAGAASGVAALAFPAGGMARAEETADDSLASMLSRHAEQLGGDGSRIVRDHSLEARARAAAANAARLAELDELDPAALSPAAAADHDTARFVYEAMADQHARYGFNDINLRPSPFVVSQMNGAYYWLPDRIGGLARASHGDDGETHLRALDEFAEALDAETAHIRHDAGLGVAPPDFILDKTLAQLARLESSSAETNPLLVPAGDPSGASARAEARFEELVRPALNRQIDALEALRPMAGTDAGVWALPDGEAYYRSALGSNTTTALAPDALHATGLEWVAELSGVIDALLRAEGMSEGSVSSRLAALDVDPRFVMAETDEGRQAILDAAQGSLDRMRSLLPGGFNVIPDDPVDIRRVSPAIEDGAPGGLYSQSRDPAEPSVIYLNLRSTAENALWRLPTLIHHEGLPGHHLQAGVLNRAGLSAFRRIVRFSAWTEGWALYAEQLADELGAYEDDPFGRIGYLQAQLFRACRVVVDTGIHHARWTREQAIAWMIENAGETPQAAEREIDRYCVYPGQACSFAVGHKAILDCRENARSLMGARFDGRAFNDMVLASGPMPMAVLARHAERWAVGES